MPILAAEARLRMSYRLTVIDNTTHETRQIIDDVFEITTEVVYSEAERRELTEDFLAVAAHQLATLTRQLEQENPGSTVSIEVTGPVFYDYNPIN